MKQINFNNWFVYYMDNNRQRRKIAVNLSYQEAVKFAQKNQKDYDADLQYDSEYEEKPIRPLKLNPKVIKKINASIDNIEEQLKKYEKRANFKIHQTIKDGKGNLLGEVGVTPDGHTYLSCAGEIGVGAGKLSGNYFDIEKIKEIPSYFKDAAYKLKKIFEEQNMSLQASNPSDSSDEDERKAISEKILTIFNNKYGSATGRKQITNVHVSDKGGVELIARDNSVVKTISAAEAKQTWDSLAATYRKLIKSTLTYQNPNVEEAICDYTLAKKWFSGTVEKISDEPEYKGKLGLPKTFEIKSGSHHMVAMLYPVSFDKEIQEGDEIRFSIYETPRGPMIDGIRSNKRKNFSASNPKTNPIQSILFERTGKNKWTEADAKKWLMEHSFKYGSLDKAENFLRFRQADPKKFKKFRHQKNKDIEVGPFNQYHGIDVIWGFNK